MLRSRVLVLSLVMLLFMSYFAFATVNEPSDWAYDEVYEATENDLVPKVLMENYQSNIKRYEYVLLAVEVLEKNGDNIKVVYERPFSDINDHEYASEIIKAYNAGLINGYEDGTFKPDKEITRQEVASLVVNLIKRIDSSKDIDGLSYDLSYSDESEIGSWAMSYIDYCYANDIMKGIGTDDNGLAVISPRGQTTIEQAIVLLYRLVLDENILNKYDLGTIDVVGEIEGEVIITESEIINDFAVYCGFDLAMTLIELSNNAEVNVVDIDEQSIILEIGSDAKINIYKSGDYVKVEGFSNNDLSEAFVDTYWQILLSLYNAGNVSDVFMESVDTLKADNSVVYDVEVSEDNDFMARVANENDLITYIFKYNNSLLD